MTAIPQRGVRCSRSDTASRIDTRPRRSGSSYRQGIPARQNTPSARDRFGMRLARATEKNQFVGSDDGHLSSVVRRICIM